LAKKNSRELSILDHLNEGDGSLLLFQEKMMSFDRKFCDVMAGGEEFTIRLEVRGDKGKVVHCRVYNDEIGRPRNNSKP